MSKSSMGAETLGATAGAEAGHRVMKILDEAWNGAESAAELRDRPYPIPLQLVGDAKDIFDTHHGGDHPTSLVAFDPTPSPYRCGPGGAHKTKSGTKTRQ